MDKKALLKPSNKKRLSAEERKVRTKSALAEAVAASKDALLFSHGHCLDGTGSVIVALRALGEENCGVFYSQPNYIHETLSHLVEDGYEGEGRTLHIMDLALNGRSFDSIVASCRALQSRGWNIEWRDHHHKSWENLDLDRLTPLLKVLDVNTDASESGASMVQQALAPKDVFARKLAETIRDRDLWWNKTADSETLEFALSWLKTDDFVAHLIGKTGRNKVVDDYIRDAAEQQRHQIESESAYLLQFAKHFTAENGQVAAVVYGNLPKNVGLHELLEGGAHIAVNLRPNGAMSIRSRKETAICHKVAGNFNGGGHPNASGGRMQMKGWTARWYVWTRGRSRMQLVANACIAELDAQ
jgi:oligoribonuclease NrnB/cAMP/cGMP phosphodiesterase (DHH superfamily)